MAVGIVDIGSITLAKVDLHSEWKRIPPNEIEINNL
jgi:hypothetical protein